MGKIPKEVYREAEDDLETLWKKAMEYGDFPAARKIIESEKADFYYEQYVLQENLYCMGEPDRGKIHAGGKERTHPPAGRTQGQSA